MNQRQQALLSRLVDGDLNDLETAEIKALLSSEPDAQKLFQEYLSASLAISALPRPSIPVDMVDRLRPFLTDRRWGWLRDSTAGTIPLWAGALGAGTFSLISIMSLMAWRDQPPVSEQTPKKMVTVAIGDARSDEKPVKDEPEKASTEASKPATVEVAANVPSMETVLNKGSRSDSAPAVRAGQGLAKSPAEKLLERLGEVDRRVAIRIHVPSINSKVDQQVLAELAQFRQTRSVVLRMMTEDEASSSNQNGGSLIYLGLVPTGSVDDLLNRLRATYKEGIELDSADEFRRIQGLLAGKAEVVEESMMSKALDGLVKLTKEQEVLNDRLKLGPRKDQVGDAIAQPLESSTGDAVSQSMDGVMIQIRSDLLSPGESRKTRKRSAVKDPK